MFRFGIIGTGKVAVKFCDAVKCLEGAEVLAAASKSLERAERFALEQGVPRYYGNYEEMLQAEKLDAVYIATTNNFHFENVMLCIRRRVPVLCEKSMFLTVEQAEEALGYAKKQGVFVMEAMWSRFLPCVQKAKEWIAEERIGRIQVANYTGGIHAPENHRIFDKKLGGGAVYDLTVYPIEILLYLIDQPLLEVKADTVWQSQTAERQAIDTANNLLLKFETCQASIQTTVYARIPSPCGLYGTKGYIRMEQTHRASAVELYNEQFQLVERYTSEVVNGFEYEIEEVIRCVREGRTESSIMPHKDTLLYLTIAQNHVIPN